MKHGVAGRAAGGRVVVGVSREDGMLTLRVSDNGPGLRGGEGPNGPGIGIPSARERLDRLYGSAHRFALGRSEEGGLSVTVGITYRRLEEASRGV